MNSYSDGHESAILTLQWQTLRMRKKPGTQKLTFPQTCMTADFYDAACGFPNETFEKITRRMLGAKGFPRTRNAESFKR